MATEEAWKHQPKPEAQEKPAIGATTAQLRGWLSASDRWQPEDFEAAVRIGGKDGYDDPCPR